MYIGNTAQNQAYAPAIDYFNGDGVTTAFTLSRPVATVAQMIAAVENVIQNPSAAFTVNGNTITFTSAPPSGSSNIWVEYTSPVTQVMQPGQGTVGTAQIQPNVTITTPTLVSPIITGSTPQFTALLSGSGTYTTPAGCRYIYVRMIGGGGGGGGDGSGGGSGGAGGATTFGSGFLTANGGTGGSGSQSVGGGSAIGGDINIQGGAATGGSSSALGAMGASSFFAGGGSGAVAGGSGSPAVSNSGAGGGAGSTGAHENGGGGAGGYLEKTINLPLATYAYSVGTGGSAGAGAQTGGAGGSGIIIITAYF